MSRIYQRKFDWDEARRLHAQGVPYTGIARLFGVSDTAVQLACKPEMREKSKLRVSEWQKQGVCETCGGPCSRNRSRPIGRCVKCAALAAATSVRPTTLRCARCREWKTDQEFPMGVGRTDARRGRHEQCRACNTISRREHRQKNKVSCVAGCGRLVGGLSDQMADRRRGKPGSGLCQSCANRAAAARKRA